MDIKLSDRFISPKKKLSDRFPLTKKSKLREKFPYKSRVGGVGSGFLNSSLISIAAPTYEPPVPSFSTRYGTQSSSFSINTLPPLTATYTGFDWFLLTNTTDDTTYTSLEWKVTNRETGNQLLPGINQTYVIVPNQNPTGVQSWEIELTAFYRGLEGKAYQIIETYPASLNGNSQDFTTTVTAVVGDVVPFTFTNSSAGPYTRLEWSATGITLIGSGETVTGDITVDFANIQQPFSVTLTLYGPNDIVLETITQTTTFIVLPRAIARLNGNNNDFSTTSTIEEGSILSLSFENNSVGTYDTFTWASSPGFILNGTGTTVTSSRTVGFPQQPPYPVYTVTLRLFRNLVEVDSVTQTITIVSVAKPNRSLFDSSGNTAKKVNDGVVKAIELRLNTVCGFYPYPYYSDDNFSDYLYTRPAFKTIKYFITSPNGTQILDAPFPPTSPNFTPVAPSGQTNALYNIVMKTYDSNGIENGQSYLDLIYTSVPVLASLNGNTSNYTTSNIAASGAVLNYSFTNTSPLYLRQEWVSAGITLVGTGSTVTGSITVGSGVQVFTVTLKVYRTQAGAEGMSQVTQTTTITPNSPANNQVILVNAVSLLDITPLPQSNVSNYSGIHVRWIPTGVGVAAIEPVNFKVQTVGTVPVTAGLSHFQGNNAATAILTMSADSTLTAPSSDTYTLAGVNQTISETMSWNPNYLGSNTFTNAFVSQAATLTFNQPINTTRFFDSLDMSVRTGTTKTYVTAYQCYCGMSFGTPSATILADANYFVSAEGRYVANQNLLASVTFQVPAGNRVVAVMTGGLLVNAETTPIYGHIHTGFQASLVNVTSKVSNNLITLKKASGAQGSLIGFFVWNLT